MKLSEDMHRLKQEKQALEVDMQLMKKERDLAKTQAINSSGQTHWSGYTLLGLKLKQTQTCF